MAFFFGILHTNNIIIAYVFGFLAGMANSFLDAGTYPSLMEAFPRSPGTANILITAFVSSGQFLLPLIISLLVWAELWFGWSFMIAAGIMFINALFLYRCTFPPHPGRRLPVIKKNHQLYGTSLFNYRFSQLYLIWLYLNGNLLSG
ncbi:major facilitator superfamily protein [Escherichia coli]|uniref:Major facilitator superfamily protein n=1 Tax=Escherichia coli TaxID=562 RepID=A0A447XWX0_ECOLX|nr:major facilitator superfamily protein [Escherichia coli]